MSFDKYFNSIQDKASRYYRRLADLDDLIYDKYFNKFRGKTVFEAEVLSNPGEVPAEGSTANTDLFIPLRVRIKDIHDNRLPDPYDAVKGITDEVKKLNEFRKLILSHPVAYPDTKNLMQSAISQGLTQGSIVEVYFAEEGPDFNGRMRGLRYRQVIVAAPARTIPNELSIASGFEGGETLAVGDGAGIANPEILNGNEELKRRVEALIPHLQAAGYNEPITINSAVRTPEGQVRAMMGNLFKPDGSWHPEAKDWITLYDDQGVKNLVNLRFDSKTPKDQFEIEFSNYVISNISRITSHVGGNAVDIKTRDIPYANILIMKEGLEKAKSARDLKSFAWERIDGDRFTDNKRQRESGKVLAIDNEHIHITFKDVESE